MNIEDVRAAATRIADHVHRTPVLTSTALDETSGRKLFFKCENFQRVGAFKIRGACNALLQIPEPDLPVGVVTHSSGNHAQGVALAARLRGIPAYIVMPNNAPAVKKAAVAGYGAKIFECAPTLKAREATAAAIQRETGATFISPYDHPHIIAGQGTAALEFVEEVPNLDVLLAPVGGGGLLSGTCLVAAAHKIPVYGAEPAGADDAARSFAAGERIMQTGPDTIADGLLTSLGDLTWPVIRDGVAGIITVRDDEIIAALRLVWERMKIVIEPSAAVAVAAAVSADFKSRLNYQRVGIILSGGNVDLARCAAWFGPAN